MDLALSPDWPAQYCYLIVIVIGFFVASLQIERLYQGFPQAWIMFSTWVLFSIFLLLPVALFWFLDRTDTLHDTSLFGAIFVAVAYRQILVGRAEKVPVPSQASKIWERLMNWADEQAGRIRQRMERNADAFDQKVISRLTVDAHQRERVLELLKFHSEDFTKIQNELTRRQETWLPLGPEVSQRKAADFLYRALRLATGPNFTDLMYREKITSWTDYYWYGRELRSRVVQCLVIGALLMACLYLFYQAIRNPKIEATYHLFRLAKVNATAEDRSRTRRELGALIDQKRTFPYICDQLSGLLRYDAVPVETAERVLATLLERRDTVCDGQTRLARRLVDALRTESPDVRMRIHNSVLFLAGEQGGQVEQTLTGWKPAKNESAPDVEGKIRAWHAFWERDGGPSPAGGSPTR